MPQHLQLLPTLVHDETPLSLPYVLEDFDMNIVRPEDESISVDEIVWRYELVQCRGAVRSFVRSLIEARRRAMIHDKVDEIERGLVDVDPEDQVNILGKALARAKLDPKKKTN